MTKEGHVGEERHSSRFTLHFQTLWRRKLQMASDFLPEIQLIIIRITVVIR
jgi:hypothetical protein